MERRRNNLVKIVGLLVARDEEPCIGMTIESVKDLVDAIIFIDHASKDKTKEIVKAKCSTFGIHLRTFTLPPSWILADLRLYAWERAKSLNPDYTFTIDGDMIYIDDMDKEYLKAPPGLELFSIQDIRKLAEKGEYDFYNFPTLNFSLDLNHTAAMNMPHLYLLRYKPGVQSNANFHVDPRKFKQDYNRNRFMGWNLTYQRSAERIFYRRHMPGQRFYNRDHKTRISVDQFIKLKYGKRGPTKKQIMDYVIGIFQPPKNKEEDREKYGPRNWEKQSKPVPYDFDKYGALPKILANSSFMEYEMIFDKNGICIGRYPDMIPEG